MGVPDERDLFDRATAVTDLGAGRYGAVLDENYSVLGNPNGGYLLAVMARAAAAFLDDAAADHTDCLAASAAFSRAPALGEVEVEVSLHRRGTRVSHLRTTVRQAGVLAVEAQLACGRLPDAPSPRYELPRPFVLPDPEACERRPATGLAGVTVAIMDRVDLRLDPATTGFVRGELSDLAEFRGWLRLADGRRMDPLALLFALDVLPPATFAIGSSGWVPTVQLTAYVRAVPVDGWLAARQLARAVGDGFVDEVCELWDADGHVVAQATQLAMVRFAD